MTNIWQIFPRASWKIWEGPPLTLLLCTNTARQTPGEVWWDRMGQSGQGEEGNEYRRVGCVFFCGMSAKTASLFPLCPVPIFLPSSCSFLLFWLFHVFLLPLDPNKKKVSIQWREGTSTSTNLSCVSCICKHSRRILVSLFCFCFSFCFQTQALEITGNATLSVWCPVSYRDIVVPINSCWALDHRYHLRNKWQLLSF